MTQNEKDLLLKDICTRLPYGVIVGTTDNDGTIPDFWSFDSYNRLTEDVRLTNCDVDADRLTDFCDVRPYLFPISSMSEEQKEEYYSLADDVTLKRGQGSYLGIKIHCIKLGISDNPHEGVWDDVDLDAIDWLNKNHFDYRGLIPMGLAIDATDKNIY